MEIHKQTQNGGRKKVIVEMTLRDYKKFVEYKEAERIAKILKKGMAEIQQHKEGKIKLKSLQEMLDEI